MFFFFCGIKMCSHGYIDLCITISKKGHIKLKFYKIYKHIDIPNWSMKLNSKDKIISIIFICGPIRIYLPYTIWATSKPLKSEYNPNGPIGSRINMFDMILSLLFSFIDQFGCQAFTSLHSPLCVVGIK